MNKVHIQNLALIITDNCTLNCRHCERGHSLKQDMSKKVIEKTLDQIAIIGNLCICGGEPTLAIETMKNIDIYLINHNIIVEEISITINGTNYSTTFLKLLDTINDHKSTLNIHLAISYDDYHLQEIERLGMKKKYLENIKKYAESKYFYGLRNLDPKLKLFREGNAETLDQSLTVPLKPIDIVVAYAKKKPKSKEKELCNIGPLMAVNTEGIITEENASIEHQRTLYNYGNVFVNTLEEIALERGRIVKPKQWNKETAKIIKKYITYNK